MSREDIALARRMYEAWNEGGPGSAREFWAEDLVFHDPPNLPDSREVQGRDEVTAYLTEQAKVIGDMKVNIVDVVERGRSVVMRMELRVHGAESGLEVPGELTQVMEVADGRLQRIRVFFSWDEGLEAADLPG